MTSDVPVRRTDVLIQAQAMLLSLDSVLPARREELMRDPVAVLQTWSEIVYREVAATETGGRCSVAGAYYGNEDPPLLLVAHAASSGRRAFTALHELGHHLQQSDFDLDETAHAHGANRAEFEDAACDAFAAEMLLPEDLVNQHLPAGTPTADDVAALHAASSASRAAACVRAVQRLSSPGLVVLLDNDGTVQFAATHQLPRPTRDSDQSHAEVVSRALSTTNGRARGRNRFRYRDGIEGDELYAQAAPMDGYLVLVAVTERPPWEHGFTLPIAQTGPQASSYICARPECGSEFDSYDRPCPRCRTPKCPECGASCGCALTVKEKTCQGCFRLLPLRYFDTDSDRCQDCA
jgi:Zn-dependent peptidase ImmA (M78 family)